MIEIKQHVGKLSSNLTINAEDYAALDQTLRASEFDGSAAEAHGIACGLVCRGVSMAGLDSIAANLQFVDEASVSALHRLYQLNTTQLNDPLFNFDLFLPKASENLTMQLESLGKWCHGFIIALMHDGNAFMSGIDAEQRESVDDIIKFSNMDDVSILANEDQSENDLALQEIREYTRIAVQLIFEELNPNTELKP